MDTKNIKTAGISLLVLAILGGNAFALYELVKLNQRIDGVEHLMGEVSPNLEQRIDVATQKIEDRVSKVNDATSTLGKECANRSSDTLHELEDLINNRIEEVNNRIDEVNNRIDEIDRLSVEIPPDLEQRIGTQFELVAQRVEEHTVSAVNSATSSFDEKCAKALDKSTAAFSAACEVLSEETKKRISGNEVAAEEASKMAEKSKLEGDFVAAKRYCLNAITHAPTQSKYFEQLFEICDKNPKASSEDWEQLRGCLTIAEINVSAGDVPKILELQNQIAAIADAKEKEHQLALEQQREDLKKELAEKYSWERMPSEISAKIKWLNDRWGILDELGDEAESEAELTISTSNFYSSLREVESILDNANELLDKCDKTFGNGDAEAREADLKGASSRIQVADGALSQIRLSDFSKIHDSGAAKKALSDLTKKLLASDKSYEHQISREHEEKARKILVQIEETFKNSVRGNAKPSAKGKKGNFTQEIEKIEKLATEFSECFAKIACSEHSRELGEKAKSEDFRKKLSELNIKRRTNYNLWAIREIEAAWRMKDDNNEPLTREYLERINQSLLNPAISALYATVFGKLFAEKVDAQIEIAEAEKLELERF